LNSKSIILFADRLPPLIGGMETHAYYFIKHFTEHLRFPLVAVVTKNNVGQNYLVSTTDLSPIGLQDLEKQFQPAFIFFNSGRWIEEMEEIRNLFPNVCFLYRTGGNEILKAPLIHQIENNHRRRQSFWVAVLNNYIDILITNSIYTERRLQELGVTCRFAKCVGGVNTSALRKSYTVSDGKLTLFCAARFVPYKNHVLLLSVIHKLILRGHNIQLRLAGDGPLLPKIKEQVLQNKLNNYVEFLGVLNNEETCQEIARARVYIQFSGDQLTEVPGGSYVHSECMGRSILEALTAGTFIIAGRGGALSEIVTNDRGRLIDLNNSDQIVHDIEKILERLPQDLPFLDDFCWTKIFKCYEALLEESNENINYD